MVPNGHDNTAAAQYNQDPQFNGYVESENNKPTYALEHLATFKVKNENEIKNPKEKMKLLIELDKTGGIWPQKMFMCFNGQWLVMLDSDMNEIENFPGSLIKEPTAFISEDPLETFNNILIFTIPGISLGNTEMHMFQVTDVAAVHLVEDLKHLSSGNVVHVDRNVNPIKLPKKERPIRHNEQYGIALAAAGVAAEKNAHERQQFEREALVVNHCFEDIERFIARLQFAAEAIQELQMRQHEHNSHGEGLLVLRSRPPLEREFDDILAKHKLALNYIVKLQNHLDNPSEPIHNVFTSLRTIVDVCNDYYIGANVPENVVNPLLRRETVAYLNGCLNVQEIEFWNSLGKNWTLPKDQFKDHKGSYHPIFYDDWSPDWNVDEEVAYLSTAVKKSAPSPQLYNQEKWLARLETRNVKIAQVLYNKTGHNDKELNVTKGEYLEIIDDSRNWWKARNSFGNIGYVPHTILSPYNFELPSNYSGKDTDSISSSVFEQDQNQNLYRNTLTPYVPPAERESQIAAKPIIPRSYSMPPNVPDPPPMPESFESQPVTPIGTLERDSVVAGSFVAMRSRNETPILQDNVNDELKYTLKQREQRRDLEILKTPQIYISQNSSSKEVEEWLRGKGFSDIIVRKLRTLNGEELFTLSPHIIEGYFGQKDSRRLISQIVLQKNISEYKTVRSSELSAKLARARQKVDKQGTDPNEIF